MTNPSRNSSALVEPFAPGSYSQVPMWAIEAPIPSDEKALLVALCMSDWPDATGYRKGYSTLTQRRLAAMLCTSRPRIKERLDNLQALGLVEIEHRSSRRAARVWINYGARGTMVMPPVKTPWHHSDASGGTTVMHKASTDKDEIQQKNPRNADDSTDTRLATSISTPSPSTSQSNHHTNRWHHSDATTQLAPISLVDRDGIDDVLLGEFDAVPLREEAWHEMESADPEIVAYCLALLQARHRQGKKLGDPVAWLRAAIRREAVSYDFNMSDIVAWNEIAHHNREKRIETWVQRCRVNDAAIMDCPQDIAEDVSAIIIGPEGIALVDAEIARFLQRKRLAVEDAA